MGNRLESLTSPLSEFIAKQKVFFVATAMKEGRINLSPKGIDSFRVLSPNRAIWLNLTGSGNETATHLMHHDRMTVMFCAFEGPPLILRLYGTAKVYHPRDNEWTELSELFPDIMGKRQIIDIDIDLVQTSCGYGIPLMDFNEERPQLKIWGERHPDEKLEEYWAQKNNVSLDGLPTNI